MNKKLAEIDKEILNLKEKVRNVKGEPTEVYSRIVGYYRPHEKWNRGKKEEYKIRKNYQMKD